MPRADVFVHENVAPFPGTLQGLHIREDVLYSDARGEQKARIRNDAHAILSRLEPVLARMLGPNEVIFYAARMNKPVSLLEQFTAGWLLQYMTAVAMVFTNERVICLPVSYEGAWNGRMRVVPYADLAPRTRVAGFLSKTLQLHYGMGEKERFWGLKRRDAKKIAVLLRVFLAENAAASVSSGMVSLCTACLKGLTPGVYQCGSCGLVFKDERTMRKRAVLIPGGGYFYCDSTGMGVLAVIADVYLLLEVLLVGIVIIAALVDPEPNESATDYLVTLLFFIGLLAIEKLIQIYHCNKMIREFISTGRKEPLMGATAVSGSCS